MDYAVNRLGATASTDRLMRCFAFWELLWQHAPLRADEHPVAVYLASLSASSRRTMRGALGTIARILTGDDASSAWDGPWQRLRFQHTPAIRSALQDQYAHHGQPQYSPRSAASSAPPES